MSAIPAPVEARALRWLAQREYSRDELRGKLLRLAAGQQRASAAAADTDATAEIDALLDRLVERGLLSQQRFVDSRLRAREARFGNLRIVAELQQHGVTLDAAARQALQASEYGRAHEVLRKKFGQPATDAAGRLRQMRFLGGRGFSAEVIRQVLRSGIEVDA